MSRRPDIGALVRKTVEDAGEGSNVHPLRPILKDENVARVLVVPVDEIEPSTDQPRKDFNQEALDDLTASVREKGLLQPIIVRKKAGGTGCIIIAGERRWRAAKAAGLKEIPVLMRGEEDALEVAIIENLQRENLSALEEAEGLQKLKDARGYTLEDLARIIGKSAPSVSESLVLVRLPEDIKAEILGTPSDVRKFQKSQLLQVFRAGEPGKVRAAWDALRDGEAPTVRALRARTRPLMGRPKSYSHVYAPSGSSFSVTVRFKKAKVGRSEVRNALEVALRELR